MRNFKYLIIIASVSILFFSCADKLDLKPYQSLDESVVLTTDANVKSTLIGAYNRFKQDYIFGGINIRNSELFAGADELSWQGTYNAPREIFNHQIISSNGDITSQWMESYDCINVCNNVLSALDVVNEEDQGTVEGEALFLRSLMYFDLVRFFGETYESGQENSQPGVPIVLTPTRGIGEENFLPRNTVEEVYDLIITDLEKAATLLPEDNGYYASWGAAKALLARVYLQQGNFTSALAASNEVLESGLYALTATYAEEFNNDEATSEDIFVTKFTSADGVSPMTEFWSTTEYGGRDGDIEILDGHLNLYDPADERLALFWIGNDAVRSGKWNNQYGLVNHFRLAEMYLIRAECNQRLASNVGASPLDDYNTIHTRAGLPAAASIILDDILLERRLELAHEGFRFHDAKRLKETVGSYPYNDPDMLFPIPQREIEVNTSLVQNEGY
ncbi:MAG: RagB/SusD family nutrient uptake outer membrane protein [Bacteroidales bacterium]